MGKTIMLSALIQTSIPTQGPEEESNIPLTAKQLRLNNAFRPVNRNTCSSSATLVVAPTSLLNQWAEELKRSSKPGTLDVFIWHGQNRLDLEDVIDGRESGHAIKVVITSYGVLASEHAKMERSTITRPQVFESERKCLSVFSITYITSVTWWRVILDEAHSCKSRTSKTAKAVYALSAKRRWALTGISSSLYSPFADDA